MTQGHHFPPRTYPTQHYDLSDRDDEDLSPSDGYFGSHNPVPDTVLIPNPSYPQTDPSSDSAKAQEAAREPSSHGPKTPSETRYTVYTPATTYTPAASSRDGESAYNGSTSRYRDSEDGLAEHPPLLEEPPPYYNDAVAQTVPSNGGNCDSNPAPPFRRGYGSVQVRDPVSSLSTSACGGRRAPQSIAVVVNDRTRKIYDEESDPARPRRSRRRGCCGRKRDGKKGRSCCWSFLSVLLGTLLALWLTFQLVKIAKIAKSAYGHSPTPNFPVNGPPAAPPSGPTRNREFRQHETSQSISGTYPLYDLLDLQTTSGSISITIVPHPGQLPAIVRLATTSGSINVKIDKSYLDAASHTQYQDALNRTFDTKISSYSGSIGGSILVGGGGQTTVSSRSGSLNLAVYPVNVDYGNPESTLSTSTTSGSSTVKVQSPVFGGKLIQLVAHHQCTGSGSMSIKYPSTWEGGIHAKSVGSGSVSAKGAGLQFEQSGSREVMAWRGGGENRKTIDLNTLGSGSINFRC